MRTHGRVVILVACLALLGPAMAARGAKIIDTFPSWNGSDAFGPFGMPNPATVGQTFVVPPADNALQSFRFALQPLDEGATLTFRGYVMAWAVDRATGPVLFRSEPVSIPPPVATPPPFKSYEINAGGLPLVSGQRYVAFFSLSEQYDTNSGRTATGTVGPGANSGDIYAGGTLVFANNAGDLAALTSAAWSNRAGDLAFTLNFSPVPEPASAVAALTTLAIAAVRRPRRQV
jgi:hypothetical protein